MNVQNAAAAVGEGPETLRGWVTQGVVPEYTGEWTRAAIGKARLVKRILERGYSLEQVREATEQGRLLSGQLVELFGVGGGSFSQAQVARELGLDPSVVDRVAAMLGVGEGDELGEPDRHLLRYIARARGGPARAGGGRPLPARGRYDVARSSPRDQDVR